MNNYIVVYSATNEVYFLQAKDDNDAYRQFGEKILKMEGDFDLGNVDIDLKKLPASLKKPFKIGRLA